MTDGVVLSEVSKLQEKRNIYVIRDCSEEIRIYIKVIGMDFQ